MSIYRTVCAGLASSLLFSVSALAGISLDSTRIVFLASNATQGQSIGVTSSLQSTTPYLVKAQVLGDVQGTQTQTPFSVTPSLFRLEPGSTNQLRILKTGEQTLSRDKESVFYLRVMALPAGQNGNDASKTELGGAITVSTGSVVKLFYRPTGLSMTQQQAMGSLRFSRKGTVLRITNPSPYFVTLSSVTIGGKAIPMSVREQNTMIAPFGEMDYSGVNTSGKVTWQAINDFGGKDVFYGVVQ